MYGIPNMKLEKTIVERRINLMEAEGITFRTGVNVGVDVAAKQLLEEYDAVVLACGASHPRDINVPQPFGSIHFSEAVDKSDKVVSCRQRLDYFRLYTQLEQPAVKGRAYVYIL